MRPGMRMLLMSSRDREADRRDGGRQNYGNSDRSGYGDTRGNYSGTGNRSEYTRNEYGAEMRDMEARFRSGERHDHPDHGRMTDMMPDVESRRRYRRHKDGTFAPRSEMEEVDGYYPYPPYVPPIYENEHRGDLMNLIGFERQNEVHNNYGMRADHHQMDEMEHRSSPHMMGGAKSDLDMTREMADEWMSGLQNEDGTKGPHWSMEQAKQVMQQRGIQADPVTFWAVLNMMYSDYCKIFKKHGVGDRVDFYADMACAWINDKDADKHKTAAYYQYVVNQ